MKKMCYLLTMGLLVGSLTVPVFAASDADSASDKKWVIATDTVFKPFEYTDDDGNFVGIDVDVLDAIAKDQGFEYELKSLGWDASIAACQAGQADGMIAGASITDERKDSGWLFSDGYYNATQSMTVQKDSDIKGFDDLKGKTVGVKTGTQGATYAESLKDEYGFTDNVSGCSRWTGCCMLRGYTDHGILYQRRGSCSPDSGRHCKRRISLRIRNFQR